MIELSIVVPVYNSEHCLEELAKRIEAALGESWQLVLVDDCSRDGSWAVIRRLAEADARIVGVRLRRNAGQDNAIMAGLRHAAGRYVVIMDDDLQHSPSDIPALHAQAEQGYDVCYANFWKKRQKLWKNLGSWFNGKVAEAVLGKPRDIYLSPFKIMRREIVEAICRYDGPYPYIDGLILSVTSSFTQVDVEHHPRFRGRSTYTVIKSLMVWAKHATGFSVIPLRVASLAGICIAILGFLIGLILVGRYLFLGVETQGWASLVCLNLFLGGLVLVSLGIMGEYVGRSYLRLNSKPQYTIREVVGTEPQQTCGVERAIL